MADSSEGSDIDEVINSDFNEIMQVDTGPDLNDIPDDVDVPADRVVREQWIQAMFREEEGEMRDFVGFQEEWKTNNSHVCQMLSLSLWHLDILGFNRCTL
jgi:hypothetical protein